MSNFLFSVCLMFWFVCPATGEQEGRNPVASAYISVLHETNNLLLAERERAAHRLGKLEELAQRGHASWLETRRQRLKVDQLTAKADLYADFVATVEPMAMSILLPISSSLRADVLEFTDLLIEGSGRQESLLNDLQKQVEGLRNELKDKHAVRQKLHRQTHSLSDSDSWKKSFEWKLKVAAADASVCEALLSQTELLAQHAALQNAENESKPIVNDFSEKFTNIVAGRMAALKQVQIHGRLIQRRLASERQRFESLAVLQEKGMDSTRELKAVGNNIEHLKSQLQKQRNVLHLLNGVPIVDQPVVNGDKNAKYGTSNLTQLRQKFLLAEAAYHHQSAELEKEMLGEVVAKLEQAAETRTQLYQTAQWLGTRCWKLADSKSGAIVNASNSSN